MRLKPELLAVAIAIFFLGILPFPSYSPESAFGQATTTSSTSGVSVTIGELGGGGGGGIIEEPASITFSGFAYPSVVVTFRANDVVIGTELSKSDATFIKTTSVDPDYITFEISARDDYGLRSTITEIILNVSSDQNINIANIFLSPTIAADRFNVQKGGTLRIYGSSFPGSTIRVFNNFAPSGNLVGTALTNSNGLWEYFFPTTFLGDGQYSIKVNAEMTNPHLVSPFSDDLEFTIAEIQCRGADFNLDTRVNIIDFSILIFYWERNPAIGNITNICTDLNTDEVVNIFDFSILMHEWTD